MELDFGIIGESMRCLSCKKLFDMLMKNKEFVCPHCGYKIIKSISIKYCDCSHKNTDHVGFDQYCDTMWCTKCRCPKFENVRDTKWSLFDNFR